jgi:hypothetical protein
MKILFKNMGIFSSNTNLPNVLQNLMIIIEIGTLIIISNNIILSFILDTLNLKPSVI